MISSGKERSASQAWLSLAIFITALASYEDYEEYEYDYYEDRDYEDRADYYEERADYPEVKEIILSNSSKFTVDEGEDLELPCLVERWVDVE